MEFSIRTVVEEDAESIADMLIPIVQAGTYTIVEEASVESQIDFIRGFPKRGVYRVAVCHSSQKVVGIQDVQPISTGEKPFEHVGEVSTFVSLDLQRKGIGRGLCKATFQAAKERGFLKVLATIRADNPQAISFYSSQGFRVIGTAKKHAFVRNQYIDEVLAEKFIG